MRTTRHLLDRFGRWLLLGCLAMVAVGCANGPKYPPAPVAAATPDYN